MYVGLCVKRMRIWSYTLVRLVHFSLSLCVRAKLRSYYIYIEQHLCIKLAEVLIVLYYHTKQYVRRQCVLVNVRDEELRIMRMGLHMHVFVYEYASVSKCMYMSERTNKWTYEWASKQASESE